MSERIPHVESLFEDSEFVSDYSQATNRYAGADYDRLLRYTLNALQGTLDPKIVELGPGPGWCGIRLLQRRNDMHLIGLDTSSTFLAIARENAMGMGVANRAVFRIGDACHLGEFEDASVDAVISSQSFHYWDAPVEALNAIKRILRPGGVFFVTADRRDLLWGARFVVALTKWLLPKSVRESWMRSFQGAFTVEEVVEFVRQSDLKNVATVESRSRMYSIQGVVGGG
ncbi:MAG: class I SAM-dependent methyltransferase [Fuerstiella sp.]|nr:class I SAM-dependent methyltransferase [Fuerstiella sp.]